MESEHKALILAGQSRIVNIFENFRSSASRNVWETFPDASTIVSYKPFVDLVQAPLDEKQVLKEIDLFIERWPPRTLDELSAICSSVCIPHSSLWGRDGINSASSVFSCGICSENLPLPDPSGMCLFGWSGATAHGVLHKHPPRFVFHEKAHVAVVAILKILGLDSTQMSVKDMDDLCGSFKCINCKASPLLTWKECVRCPFTSEVLKWAT